MLSLKINKIKKKKKEKWKKEKKKKTEKRTITWSSDPTCVSITEVNESTISKRYLYSCVHCNIIHSSEVVEQVFISGWTDKEKVVYIYSNNLI